jgi:hypothetical protein
MTHSPKLVATADKIARRGRSVEVSVVLLAFAGIPQRLEASRQLKVPIRHLRMHRPVAAVPVVAHLVPSVAPLAHTNETKASLSSQRTVSVPVTRRNAGAGPESPFGPGGPAAPGDPAGPCGPCAPAGPAGPCGPCAPAGPAGPCGPGAGWPHPVSANIVMIAKRFKSCRIGPSRIVHQLAPAI